MQVWRQCKMNPTSVQLKNCVFAAQLTDPSLLPREQHSYWWNPLQWSLATILLPLGELQLATHLIWFTNFTDRYLHLYTAVTTLQNLINFLLETSLNMQTAVSIEQLGWSMYPKVHCVHTLRFPSWSLPWDFPTQI
jgi:hypothetical protein